MNMANKSDHFYYSNVAAAAECSCNAAEYLVQCLSGYRPENIEKMLESMHRIEHAADQKKHEMSIALAKAFVTPIDREDLASLSQSIDEVTDTIEEVLQRCYIGNIRTILPEMVEFAKKVAGCCRLMQKMTEELESFKKPARLHEIIVDINRAEEECDQFYLELSRNVRTRYTDVYEVFACREVLNYMEDCADACEHVADSVDTIVMKNT